MAKMASALPISLPKTYLVVLPLSPPSPLQASFRWLLGAWEKRIDYVRDESAQPPPARMRLARALALLLLGAGWGSADLGGVTVGGVRVKPRRPRTTPDDIREKKSRIPSAYRIRTAEAQKLGTAAGLQLQSLTKRMMIDVQAKGDRPFAEDISFFLPLSPSSISPFPTNLAELIIH
ncbi:hypothetical protein EDB87DRAFT_1575398 [Lactarius vividus]|nr:hypothetical protein EDB87DRAFT_1575398 [Lactarius vividus]